jgi:hypothetical protein
MPQIPLSANASADHPSDDTQRDDKTRQIVADSLTGKSSWSTWSLSALRKRVTDTGS